MARLNRHDRVTRGHSERVRAYSVMLGEEIGLSRDDLDKLNWAALIHDIGKLDVPESILNKEGRPTDDEWAVEDRTGDIAQPDAPDETTTVTKPGASALGSPATTTIPGSPTTTITTSQSTTTTTAPPPPPPPQAQEWLIGSGGHTTSHSYLPIDSSLAVGPLPNYDTGRDSEPGLLIQRGYGLAENDVNKMQRWWDQPGAIHLQRTTTLDIWLAVKDFDTTKTGQVVAGSYDCAADKTDCNLVASGGSSFNQATFGSDFGLVVVVMSSIDAILSADRGLILKVAVPDASDEDLWFAYATST